MDLIHGDIKRRVEDCYGIIKTAEDELAKIRGTECKHPETELVNYMWAPGHINPNTEVCKICGEIIPSKQNEWIIEEKLEDD